MRKLIFLFIIATGCVSSSGSEKISTADNPIAQAQDVKTQASLQQAVVEQQQTYAETGAFAQLTFSSGYANSASTPNQIYAGVTEDGAEVCLSALSESENVLAVHIDPEGTPGYYIGTDAQVGCAGELDSTWTSVG